MQDPLAQTFYPKFHLKLHRIFAYMPFHALSCVFSQHRLSLSCSRSCMILPCVFQALFLFCISHLVFEDGLPLLAVGHSRGNPSSKTRCEIQKRNNAWKTPH